MKKQKEEIENQSANAAKNLLDDQKGVVGVSTQKTPALSSNKSKQSFVKKLKLDTNVGKLIAFIVSFALIGGIYLAFRSFASVPDPGQDQTANDTSIFVNSKVVTAVSHGEPTGFFPLKYYGSIVAGRPEGVGTPLRTCVKARAVNSSASLFGTPHILTTKGSPYDFTNVISTKCSPDFSPFYESFKATGDSTGDLEIYEFSWYSFASNFNPTLPTTRGTMAAYMYLVANKPDVSNVDQVCGEGATKGGFTDVATYPYCKEVTWLASTGITQGYEDGTFKPDAKITRQAMSAFLYRFKGSPNVPSASTKCGSGKLGPFKDVPGTHPFCKEIEWMRAKGFSTGYKDGTYKPTGDVSNQAIATFLYRAEGSPSYTAPRTLFTDVKPEHQFYDEIQWLGNLSL